MKFLLYFIFIFMFLSLALPAHATLDTIKSKLANQGCRELPNEKYGISIQFNMLLEPGIADDGLFTITKKHQTTYQCAATKAGIIIIDYQDANQAKSALLFLQGFIWGNSGRSKMHPERIYQVGKSIVLISSYETTPLDNAFIEKTSTLLKNSGAS